MCIRALLAVFCLWVFHAKVASAQSYDYAWDFNDERALPPGFSNELKVTPEVLAALLQQATGSWRANADTAPLGSAETTDVRQPPFAAVRLTAPDEEPSDFLSAERRSR
jgi:hypothetical protein